MNIQCSSCGKSLQVDSKLAGKRVKCSCNAILDVPAGGAATAATASAPAAQAASPITAKSSTPSPSATPSPAAFGIDRGQMTSMFGELTANDMVIGGQAAKSKSTKKKTDPLAAYHPATAAGKPPRGKKTQANGTAKKRSKVAVGAIVTGVLLTLGTVAWFAVA